MAQKDKIKELVGRGLNSYHTKALQQMDRIEKKNKEQNHKISILSNELDNDYLTKTEEGSVISLEHSKEGMVYLDELQGNTLVNYCTDGSKEMTLNGDIDVEGTFVTTTEGVDNGKVDVICEGNTLVNLHDGERVNNANMGRVDFHLSYIPKKNTLYTVIFDISYEITTGENPWGGFLNIDGNAWRGQFNWNDLGKGLNVFKITTDDADDLGDYFRIGWNKENVTNVKISNLIILEGDYPEVSIPSYFTGMKSVGQDDENGHKIEILSRNKNLFDIELWKNNSIISPSFGTVTWNNNTLTINSLINDCYLNTGIIVEGQTVPSNLRKFAIKAKPNTSYTLSFDRESDASSFTSYVNCIGANYEYIKLIGLGSGKSFTFTTTSNTQYITFRLGVQGVGKYATYSNIQIEENSTNSSYVKYAINKKEILMSEPLRSLPSGKRDRFVKIGNKWYIERNCREVKGTDRWYKSNVQNGTGGSRFKLSLNDCEKIRHIRVVCNLFSQQQKVSYREEGTYISTDEIDQYDVLCIRFEDDMEESEFKSKYSDLSVVYSLETPVYEPLEIESILNTYLDITHISNNSIIPCNMRIKNSGYNAIIKPSTLYTVALDTNKSGTIGMNLGGAKVTTTNNVTTITTPATLTDDSLRLYGKGIKGSKVRLLEGDKTNWIPSHFEGMKSSFEDKVQEDGTYKMEILSNNKNLFDIDAKRYYAGWGEHNYQKYNNGFSFNARTGWNSVGYKFESCKNKMVTVCATVTCINKDDSKLPQQHFRIIPTEHSVSNPSVVFNDGETKKVTFNITLNDSARVYFIGTSNNEGSHKGGIQWFVEDISVIEGNNSEGYVAREYNKIQFSSIEPLRGVDNIKDKFVFKDGRLMIERNCSKYTIVGTENWIRHDYSNSNKIFAYAHVTSMNDRKAYTNIYCNNFATYLKSAEELKNQNNEYIWKGNASHSTLWLWISNNKFDGVSDINKFKTWVKNNPITVTYQLAEPTYEEIPFELQKIILEGYKNGTLFFDTNIPPTSTLTYAGETPIVKATKLNKTEVLNNTNDINDNIIPYLMDMDYRVVCLQLQSENINDGVSMARLFGGTYEMLQRDIQSRRYSVDEYKHRLDIYLDANKITEEEYNKLGDMLNE